MELLHGLATRIKRTFAPPPVRERTSVKVVHAENIPRTPPGFIIGVYRSGTTLLRYILDSHSRITVPPESNFLLPLAELHASEWYRKGLLGVGVDEAELLERIRDLASDIFDAYTVAKGKQRWFDKTPPYVEILDFLDRVFGEEARYLMLYRHGLDVANSLAAGAESGTVWAGVARRYAREYKNSPRVAYTRYWVDLCEKMLSFEANHSERCFRLRYEDYVVDPIGYLPPLFAFVGESWEPDVLDFTNQPHDFGLQDNKVLETKGFHPRVGTYKDWPANDLVASAKIAEPTLVKLGYEI